jgi:hypothetical protein
MHNNRREGGKRERRKILIVRIFRRDPRIATPLSIANLNIVSKVTISEVGTVDTLPPRFVVFSVRPRHVECIVGGYTVFSPGLSVRDVGSTSVTIVFHLLNFEFDDPGDSHVWVREMDLLGKTGRTTLDTRLEDWLDRRLEGERGECEVKGRIDIMVDGGGTECETGRDDPIAWAAGRNLWN